MQSFFSRAWERKKTLIFLAALVLIFTILGMCFLDSPAVYEYHLSICDSYLTEICFSDTNVFLIFLQRAGGCALLAALILAGSIHPVALLLPIAVLIFRAFTFGGSLYVFFDYYGVSGAMVAIIIYIPNHLLTDALLVITATLTLGKAFHFCFTPSDFWDLVRDFLTILVMIAFIYLAEMILLLALFHPIGKIL